ncbi:hypothetical protein BV898_19746 [Hypsibius exemplaris]|uniref:Uncharacterized protein n=1 Tax=Hypsibius exemplaris TaxID=2072580 RepID=A0A9X6NJN0_HYPEX|nr:hypothetical protein BV898_19746 [Hypsibius exemplaris]
MEEIAERGRTETPGGFPPAWTLATRQSKVRAVSKAGPCPAPKLGTSARQLCPCRRRHRRAQTNTKGPHGLLQESF